jgi:nicotinamidase-related amidase
MSSSGKGNNLLYGKLGAECRHLCVDMQRLFAEDTPWRTPWMERITPQTLRLAEHAPSRTIFTRFVPVARPGEKLQLIPELAALVPPAQILDKAVYSPWYNTPLHGRLRRERVASLIISGGETDVCVLSSVLGAIDRGYRVIIATDALCSSSDETHDAPLMLYENRYQQQVEAVTTGTILDNWEP